MTANSFICVSAQLAALNIHSVKMLHYNGVIHSHIRTYSGRKKIVKHATDGKSEEQMDVWMNKQMGVRERTRH